MNATELIDDLILKLTDWRGSTFADIRRIIHEADPEVVEGMEIDGDSGLVPSQHHLYCQCLQRQGEPDLL